ncbi:MAG: glutathione S-transferase family protein [Myxococcota bacterium]
MKLYSGPLSLFTAKVRIALDEKGLDYERVEVGWSREHRYEPHHPEVVALNPRRQVPVLVDGDLVVYDSTLILEYLEDRYPEPPLYPRDVAARARCRQIEAAADEILFPFVWDLIEEAFYPAGGSGRDESRLQRARSGIDGIHAQWDKDLAGRSWLCDEFSVADIGAFVFLNAAATLGAPPDAMHAHLLRWIERTGERPAVRREVQAMTAFVARVMAAG